MQHDAWLGVSSKPLARCGVFWAMELMNLCVAQETFQMLVGEAGKDRNSGPASTSVSGFFCSQREHVLLHVAARMACKAKSDGLERSLGGEDCSWLANKPTAGLCHTLNLKP